jgi:ribosome-binding protein aMBF1 (putative translation factor)
MDLSIARQNRESVMILPQVPTSGTTLNRAEFRISPRAAAHQKILSQYLKAAKQRRISFMKYHRVRIGLDQSELAVKTGMKQSAVARAERVGYAINMKAFTLKKIADVLGVSVDELLR